MNISIIIPIYNCSNCIISLYDSLKNLHGNKYEFVFIDDASEDDTVNKINKLKKNDFRISVYSNQQNKGPGYSRNVGIDKAKYEYLIFLDYDDLLVEKTLEQINKLEKTNIHADVYLFGFILNCCATNKQKLYSPGDDGLLNDKQLEYFIDKWQLHWMSGSPSNKIFNKNFLVYNSIKFPDNWKLWEDYMFNLMIYKIRPKVFMVNKPIFIYNYDDTNSESLHNVPQCNVEKLECWALNLYTQYLICLQRYNNNHKYLIGHRLVLFLLRAANINKKLCISSKYIRKLIEGNPCFIKTYQYCSVNMISNTKEKVLFYSIQHKFYLMASILDKIIAVIKKYL